MGKIASYYMGLYHSNIIWIKKILSWFGLSIGIGLLTFVFNPDFFQAIVTAFQDKFGTAPVADIHLAVQIFIQNIIVSAVAIFGGILLGLGSILVVVVNGFLIGYVLMAILYAGRDNFLQAIILIVGGLVPHGILEIPAFLLAATLGLRLGWEWMQKDATGNRGRTFASNFKQAIYQIPLIVLLLIFAALLEVFVSGKIVDKF
ncbi:MAG: stage II sporulation protein M [Candidatus Doudnabacteria bacterium]|nr:stage II sporulation protein M [Candidatus Doudnabacteria bacterium]